MTYFEKEMFTAQVSKENQSNELYYFSVYICDVRIYKMLYVLNPDADYCEYELDFAEGFESIISSLYPITVDTFVSIYDGSFEQKIKEAFNDYLKDHYPCLNLDINVSFIIDSCLNNIKVNISLNLPIMSNYQS